MQEKQEYQRVKVPLLLCCVACTVMSHASLHPASSQAAWDAGTAGVAGGTAGKEGAEAAGEAGL